MPFRLDPDKQEVSLGGMEDLKMTGAKMLLSNSLGHIGYLLAPATL
jgi:hypothetical protein